MAGRDRGGRRREVRDDAADPAEAARLACLRLLAVAPRTSAQLREALTRRGLAEEEIEPVLGRLREVGLVDDRAFAEAWVSSRHVGRGLGRRALAAELRTRGVHRDTVEEAVAVIDSEAELVAARALVRRRLLATEGVPPEVRVRRLTAMLARKGYGAGLAYRAVRAELADCADAVDGDEPLDDDA